MSHIDRYIEIISRLDERIMSTERYVVEIENLLRAETVRISNLNTHIASLVEKIRVLEAERDKLKAGCGEGIVSVEGKKWRLVPVYLENDKTRNLYALEEIYEAAKQG